MGGSWLRDNQTERAAQRVKTAIFFVVVCHSKDAVGGVVILRQKSKGAGVPSPF